MVTDSNGAFRLSGVSEGSHTVEAYEASGGTKANTLRDTGIPIIVVTTLGVKSGKIRKIPLMRVEHDGEYALVASKGGAPAHPALTGAITPEALGSL